MATGVRHRGMSRRPILIRRAVAVVNLLLLLHFVSVVVIVIVTPRDVHVNGSFWFHRMRLRLVLLNVLLRHGSVDRLMMLLLLQMVLLL